MNARRFFLKFLGRVCRFSIAILLIYASMVFYLVLTERSIAYPRAILHKESRDVIKDAMPLTCSIDSIDFEGFLDKGVGSDNNTNSPVILYFPDANEDVAQFFAETIAAKNTWRIGYNYRGSGKNKGTPGESTFIKDAFELASCAEHLSQNIIYAGRGLGAIAAAKVRKPGAILLLIDPNESVAQKIADKYKILFPKFLVHSALSIEKSDLDKGFTIVLEDRVSSKASNEYFLSKFQTPVNSRHGATLSEALDAMVSVE